MKYLLPLFLLIGCTKSDIGCKVEEAALLAGSTGIALKLECKNTAEIKKDLAKLTAPLGLCSKEMASMKIPFVCPMLSKALSTQLEQLGAKIPARWECSPTATKEMAVDAFVTVCEKVL